MTWKNVYDKWKNPDVKQYIHHDPDLWGEIIYIVKILEGIHQVVNSCYSWVGGIIVDFVSLSINGLKYLNVYVFSIYSKTFIKNEYRYLFSL